MPTGDCFHCHQPGHWARDCPLKTLTKTTPDAAASPPVIHCPCDGAACVVLTSKTEKNPDRRFYKCSAVPSCGFFKWCDQVSIKSQSISSVNPTCLCGAGPCRRVTVIDGPNAHRSYFVCCIKKWEDDAQNPSEAEDAGHGGSPCSTLISFSDFGSADDENLLPETVLISEVNVKNSSLGVVVVPENSTPSNEFTISIPGEKNNGNRVVVGIEQSLGKKSIPVCSRFNNLEAGVFSSADGRNQVYDDAEEQVLPSLAPKHIEPQLEVLSSEHPTNGALLEFNGKEAYALELVEATCVLGATSLSQNTSDPVLNGTNKPEHQSTTSGEIGASFSGSSSLIDLIEQYNSEKLHFKSVSMKHVDAVTAFTGSYKQLESLRHRAHSLRKQLLEVEKQVNLYEAETSEFATSLQEVSGDMVKLQKKMVEAARKVVKEVRVYKQRNFEAP